MKPWIQTHERDNNQASTPAETVEGRNRPVPVMEEDSDSDDDDTTYDDAKEELPTAETTEVIEGDIVETRPEEGEGHTIPRRSNRDKKQPEFFQISSVSDKMPMTNITNLIGVKWQKGYLVTPEGRVIQLRTDATAPCRMLRKGKPFTLYLEERAEEGQG